MSILTIFTREAPTLGGLTFDAVLEDTFEAAVEFTTYPIETGANVTDHGIIQPFKWRIIGAVSNTPLTQDVADFTGIADRLLDASSELTGLIDTSAGLIAGSDATRAGGALDELIKLMVSRIPFDIDAGDIQLFNMIIVSLNRTKDPSNENGLIFEAQLQELTILDTILNRDFPTQSQLRTGDPSKSQIAQLLEKGEASLVEITGSIVDSVNEVLAQ